MPELRFDPLQQRWVILAPERQKRPNAFLGSPLGPDRRESCPFCEGHEAETPPEVLSVRLDGSQPDRPGWRVRVVPNKYPALHSMGPDVRSETGLYSRMDGLGAHEVIIENPEHGTHLSDAPVEQVERVVWAYRERAAALSRNERMRHILLFKNHGPAAGATLAHPHTQIIALPVPPPAWSVELLSATEHYRAAGRCMLCDMIAAETRDGVRVVEIDETMVAFAPFASRFPFEIMLAPRYHLHSFAESSDKVIGNLAMALKSVLFRIKTCLGDPAFNLLIHTGPTKAADRGRECAPYYHWRAEILPRITGVAGFEWGTGSHINTVAPEEAAKRLREVVL